MAISGYSGTLNNGEVITLSGSGFGTKSQAAPLASSYDNATSGENFHNMTVGNAPSGNWGSNGAVTVESTGQRTSLYQSDRIINCDLSDSNYNFLTRSLAASAPYCSFWWRLTGTLSIDDVSNTKFVMLYPNAGLVHIQETFWSNDGGPVDIIRVGQDEGSPPYDEYTNMIPSNPFQTWHHMQILASSSHWRTTQDNQTSRDWTGLGLGTFNSNAWRFGHCTGPGTSGIDILIDQVYIDDTQAHVFISDYGSFSNYFVGGTARHTEIQVCSAWSDTEIQFRLNRGSFGATDQVYIYVVDSSGTVMGYGPVTLGSGGGLNRKPFVGWGFWGAPNARARANFWVSWGLMGALPGALGGLCARAMNSYRRRWS